MARHAKKSPSSAHRWGGEDGCTASVQAQEGIANSNSDASRYGTCGHQMCAEVLLDHTDDLQSYINREMWWCDEGYEYFKEEWPFGKQEPAEKTTVDQPLIDACWTHVDFVREQVALLDADLFVEERVPVDHITAEEGATGSADTILIAGRTLIVIDLKLGRRQVDAYVVVRPAQQDFITGEMLPEIVEPNEQIAMYASGAIEKFSAFYDIDEVVLLISQPLLNHVSQWSGTVADLNKTIDRLRRKARECDENPTFNPSVENCFFCRAKGSCEAQTKLVVETTLVGFEDVETASPKPINPLTLGSAYALVPLVESWAKAVVERTRQQLESGVPVVRSDGLAYKLVEGRKGNREWTDPAAAEAWLKNRRLTEDLIYTRKLVGPAKIEELTKVRRVKKGEPKPEPILSKLQWERLQELIKQDDGKPAIALQTDPRPAVSTTDGFEDVPTADDDEINGDLF